MAQFIPSDRICSECGQPYWQEKLHWGRMCHKCYTDHKRHLAHQRAEGLYEYKSAIPSTTNGKAPKTAVGKVSRRETWREEMGYRPIPTLCARPGCTARIPEHSKFKSYCSAACYRLSWAKYQPVVLPASYITKR